VKEKQMKIQVQRTKRWNRYDFLPHCDTSRGLLELVSSARARKAFMPRDLKIIARIGFEIEYVNNKGEIVDVEV
jgi:hypothetical protein